LWQIFSSKYAIFEEIFDDEKNALPGKPPEQRHLLSCSEKLSSFGRFFNKKDESSQRFTVK
jgi:hypothetical protein